MISQTEFASKNTKMSMSAARKKMREDLADKAEIHEFRGVSGSISWLVVQTRPDVSCQFCASSMVVRRVHQHSDVGLKIRRVSVARRRFVEYSRSCWLTGRVHLRCNRSVVAGREKCSVNPIRVAITQEESHSAKFVGC